MLGSVRALGFSKTARSGPGHDKARGGLNSLLASSVFGRRHADDIAKGPAESAKASEAGVEANVGHASVGLAQHEHRALDAPALEVAMRRLAEGRLEGPDEVGLGNVGDGREVVYIERLRVGAVDRVSGAKHSAVDLLDGLGHALLTVAAWVPPASKRARQ